MRVNRKAVRALLDSYLIKAKELYGFEDSVELLFSLKRGIAMAWFNGKISLNRKLILEFGDDYLNLVLPHELAHLVDVWMLHVEGSREMPYHSVRFWQISRKLGEDLGKRAKFLPLFDKALLSV